MDNFQCHPLEIASILRGMERGMDMCIHGYDNHVNYLT